MEHKKRHGLTMKFDDKNLNVLTLSRSNDATEYNLPRNSISKAYVNVHLPLLYSLIG